MEYKVRVTGRKDGQGYEFSYGRQSHKLIAEVLKSSNGQFTCIINGESQIGKLKDLKLAWGNWAASNYKSGHDASPVPQGDDEDGHDNPPDAAPLPQPDDELDDSDRHLFEILSTRRGVLSEDLRSRLRLLLKRMLGVQSPPMTGADLYKRIPPAPQAAPTLKPPSFKAPSLPPVPKFKPIVETQK